MPLSQADRIAFSSKIATADSEITSIQTTITQVQDQQTKAHAIDNGNKNLVDSVTALINPYQAEKTRYDGFVRTTLLESDMVDAANFVLGNAFYPNDINNLPLSLTGPWTKTKPYALTKALGKTNVETFPSTITHEITILNNALSKINTIELSHLHIERVTGQTCASDVTSSKASLVSDYNNLLNDINTLSAHLSVTLPLIWTSDPDSTRQAQNNNAIANLNTMQTAISTWLSYPAFAPISPPTCTAFFSTNPMSLGSTRLRSTELNALKTALNNRLTFVNSRDAQLATWLGSITQNLTNGDTSGSGFYFQRWQYILLRLNTMGGSLNELKGFDRTIQALNDQISVIQYAKTSYMSVLPTTTLIAPANNTKNIFVKNSSLFSVGDIIYVMADNQQELVRSIASISGSKIILNDIVPAKYTDLNNGRIYKDIS